MNIVFLCSGGGGNLKFIRECKEHCPDAALDVRCVLADRPCPAVDYAETHEIASGLHGFNGTDDETICAEIDRFEPDVIVTNIHRILAPALVERYSERLLNLHYSLLPLYAGTIGATPVKNALDDGCRFVGTTVHHVVEEVDAGPIVSQSVVEVRDGESFEGLMDRVFRSGCVNLLNALLLLKGDSQPSGLVEDSLLAPISCRLSSWRFNAEFWLRVRA